jgi:hypothetical protein
LFRVLLVGLAAVISFITAYLDANDLWRSFQNVVVPYFVIAGVLAAVLAFAPGTSPWSYSRRAVTAMGGVVLAVTALPVLLFALAASGCACSSGGPNYVPPSFMGIQTETWIPATLAGGPILLVVAASALPDRLRQRLA